MEWSLNIDIKNMTGCVMPVVNNWHQYRKIKGTMNWTEQNMLGRAGLWIENKALHSGVQEMKPVVRRTSMFWKETACLTWLLTFRNRGRPIYRTATLRYHPDFAFYIFFSTNISTAYFEHAAHSPFFSSKCLLFHNATFFSSCIIHILHTGCAKI
jgi:hypothetical protein